MFYNYFFRLKKMTNMRRKKLSVGGEGEGGRSRMPVAAYWE
jgi:hypothetical protein